jgi:cytochrome b561
MIGNTEISWGWMAKLFHWLMFFVIVGAYVAVNMHELFEKGTAERDWWMMLHKSFGLTVFVLVWLRLGWRMGQPVPENFAGPLMSKLASIGHGLLYLLMIVVPASALLMSQLAGRPVSWFGVFELRVWLDVNKELAGQLKDLHAEVLAPALLVLIIAHLLGALWHHFFDKDDILKRMLPFWRSRGL